MTVSVNDGPLVECLLSGCVAITHRPLFFLLFF